MPQDMGYVKWKFVNGCFKVVNARKSTVLTST